jgi:FtsH-binding integral membrane protein
MCTIGGLTIVGLSLCKDLNRDLSILLTGLFVTIVVAVSNLALTSQPEALLMGLTLALQVILCWGLATVFCPFPEVKVLDQICRKLGRRLPKAKKNV